MTLIIIILASWILYKAGAAAWFLDKCRVDDTTPAPATDPNNARKQLETDARYILTMQGKVNPDTVAYMGDEMLTYIIRSYIDV